MPWHEVVTILTGGVSAIAATFSAIYARQQTMSQERRRLLCRNLAALIDALQGVAYAGKDIGTLLGDVRGSLDPNSRDRVHGLESLIHAVAVQNENLKAVNTAFREVERVLEVKLPQLSELSFFVSQKGRRLVSIHLAAEEALRGAATSPGFERVAPALEMKLEELLRFPGGRVRRPVLDHLEFESDVRPDDDAYERLVACIKPLREFVHCECRGDDLM